MDNNNEQPKGLQLSISPEVAKGQYTNLAMINHSNNEFVIDFAYMLPVTPPQIISRMILAPEHAKRLLFALQDNVMKYEKAFGPINLPGAEQPQGGRTATPFGVPEGNA